MLSKSTFFTGEDVVELQGHGGPVIQNALLGRLFELGAIAAKAGNSPCELLKWQNGLGTS